MKVSAARLVACTSAAVLAVSACGGSADEQEASPRAALPVPPVVLTQNDKRIWTPLPPDRTAIPVLLYHGIGPASQFSNQTDAEYGIDVREFAKQMTMMARAGYQTVGLRTFLRFVEGKRVTLPPRPLLITFDDARADSWTGGDSILRKLGFQAVMFVDVGRVDDEDPEYMTWDELTSAQASGRWQLQLHAGHGHVQIKYGPGDDDYGAFYAYREEDEDFDGWQERTRSDIEWGQETLADHISRYRPLAFAPPYGNYGQDGSNDARIAPDLLAWLTGRYDAVFVQDENARAKKGSEQPLGRIQVDRSMTGGEVFYSLLSGKTP